MPARTAPGLERSVIVVRCIFHVHLYPSAQLPNMLVECRLRTTGRMRQPRIHVGPASAFAPPGRAFPDRAHPALQGPRRSTALGQRAAFQHHRAGIAGAMNRFGRVGAWVSPRCGGRSAHHSRAPRQDSQPSIGTSGNRTSNLNLVTKPEGKLAHREVMTHGIGRRANEALSSRPKRQPLHRSPGLIGRSSTTRTCDSLRPPRGHTAAS